MSRTAFKGDWVQIKKLILSPQERPDSLPEDTKEVPLEMWVKGFLDDKQGEIGDEVQIETVIGRKVTGTLVSISPGYHHDFGVPPKELLTIGKELRSYMKGVGYGG
ncbi:2-amino-4-oxopentanoate thiolase subunit OrtA [Natranaerobius trueperi]|uniref:2-amino-4-ketopentanoate thiolase n=1 Tax=Natranaerobius trueperi TaxID=759412 RepID=A0A226BY66_9FIRM|nr:2-amino-4-oxopentanoate thiolase subunit OrtA [Natranaerobius trueperi]OWZ83139.1 2-amino-4-ketopentanoate thiolase [Natranaerobius trueperi]